MKKLIKRPIRNGKINCNHTSSIYKDVVNPALTIDTPSDNTYCNSIPDIQGCENSDWLFQKEGY